LLGSDDGIAAGELLRSDVFDGDPVERAAWIALASVLLNLDEFITRE
jgi:hypothetical protein